MRTYTRTASSTRLSPAFAGVTRQVLSGGPRAGGCYKDASENRTTSTAYLPGTVGAGDPTVAPSLEKVLTDLRRS